MGPRRDVVLKTFKSANGTLADQVTSSGTGESDVFFDDKRSVAIKLTSLQLEK